MFNEKGKFEEIANKLRTKAKLHQLHQEIQTISKKTGISSDSRLALIQPKRVTTVSFDALVIFGPQAFTNFLIF